MRVALLITVGLIALAGCNEEGADGFGRIKPQQPGKPPALRAVAAPKPLQPYKVQPVAAPKPLQAFKPGKTSGPRPIQPHKGQPAQAKPYEVNKQKAPVVRPDPKHVAAQQLLLQKKK